MISNAEHAGLTEAELNYRLGIANLDAALRLCQDMIDGRYTFSFDHGTVILSLFHHAIELFLKYALLRKGIGFPRQHYIRGLFERYTRAYPDSEFSLPLPFVTEFLGHTEEEMAAAIAEEEHDKNRTDQMVRYHTDREGNPWDMAQTFDPGMFLVQAEVLSHKFIRLRERIENDLGQQSIPPDRLRFR